MVLIRRFSRGFLFIAVAASFGMFAQEMVSRILLAGDHPSAQASASSRSWRSAESYYSSHPGIVREQETSPVGGDSGRSGRIGTRGTCHRGVCRTDHSPVRDQFDGRASSGDGPQSPALLGGATSDDLDACSTDAPTLPETYQFAAVDDPPPVTERRPASIPSLVPTETAELPAPEVRATESQPPDAELLPPPSPPRRVRGPMDVAKSDPDYPMLQNPDPSACSYARTLIRRNCDDSVESNADSSCKGVLNFNVCWVTILRDRRSKHPHSPAGIRSVRS
jgi:hypothetical protein